MHAILELTRGILIKYDLIVALALVGAIMWISYWISNQLTRGRLHGSAIAILVGLVLAFIGGRATGGENGLADVAVFAGVGVLGGTMLRDFAIISTAFGVDVREIRRAGPVGVISLFLGVVVSFIVGACVGYGFGYRDAVSLTTIGGGAATYIVGPVTGSALGATKSVQTLSFAVGLVKAILVMIATPLIAKSIGLNNPRTAMIFGGLMGTTSGVTGGLAATDARLVPYGAMTATFYTGLGCLMGPSIIFIVMRMIFG